jgi:molecular chaperone GrpE
MKHKEDSDHNNKAHEDKAKIHVVDRRHRVPESEEEAVTEPEELDHRYPSYVEKLKQEAEEKDKRLREYIAAYKEKSGENDEFRQRLQRENLARLDQFKANLFSRLVPILDNLKRASKSAETNEDFDSLKQGIEMVIKLYSRELEDNEVQIIDTRDRMFDPKIDEAFMTEPTEDPDLDNKILEELEPGYMYKDKLIKPAKVKVGKLKQ